jgi:hypothetical protein
MCRIGSAGLGCRSARTVSCVPPAEAPQKGHGRSQSAKSGLGHQREAVRRIGAGERRDEPIIVKRCHVEGRACTGRGCGGHHGGPVVTKRDQAALGSCSGFGARPFLRQSHGTRLLPIIDNRLRAWPHSRRLQRTSLGTSKLHRDHVGLRTAASERTICRGA